MGSLLNRSSSVRPEGSKSRWRKGKGKRFRRMEPSTEGDHTYNDNEHKNSNANLINSHEEWKRIEQQQQQLANMNGDPPGAPSTYPSNFPMMQNDLMTQSWSSHHDVNNQYYPGNSHSMPTTSNMPYDPNQYVHTHSINPFINQTQQVTLEERSSKKVQFARPIEQRSSLRNPLTSTQSFPDLNITNTDVSTSTTRPETIISRQSLHRPLVPKSVIPLTQIPLEKPIYVGIDHRATLAERGQTTAHKHHHKNNIENGNNHRTRSHTHHPHKHQESTDSSTSRNNMPTNRSFDPTQVNRTLTTTSTSTVIPSKSIPHTEQSIFNDNEIKISKNRNNRQHSERQTVIVNDIKSSRSRPNHSQTREQQQQQPQQRTTINRNNSPLRTEAVRRVENKQMDTPVLTAHISQSQQQQQPQSRPRQSTMPSTLILTANSTRTRV